VELISAATVEMDDCNGWDFENRAKTILTQLKINNLTCSVKSLSGGQLKRLALAILLVDDADIFILDEPTNHLDLEMAEWLEEY
ncbi:MAG: ATP-binding cassette domain-containing protein, partial [Rikenellaceae bacterium]